MGTIVQEGLQGKPFLGASALHLNFNVLFELQNFNQFQISLLSHSVIFKRLQTDINGLFPIIPKMTSVVFTWHRKMKMTVRLELKTFTYYE